MHNHPQSPTITHNPPQSPRKWCTITHNHPQSPTITHTRPQSPTITHNHPQSPRTWYTITHNHPQSPRTWYTITHNHPQSSITTHNHPGNDALDLLKKKWTSLKNSSKSKDNSLIPYLRQYALGGENMSLSPKTPFLHLLVQWPKWWQIFCWHTKMQKIFDIQTEISLKFTKMIHKLRMNTVAYEKWPAINVCNLSITWRPIP